MQQPIGLLSDNINWVQPLARAMDAAGVPSRLIPFPHPPFTEFDGRAYPKVIFNRVAIRTAMGSPGMVTLVRDLLSALQLQGKYIINNRHCHHVGGFGAGVWAHEPPDQDVPLSILAAAFAADGVAVWQQRYIPRDDVIYRVEMLSGEVLYRARVPVEPDSFNYCLGNAGSFSGPGTPEDPVTLDHAPETKLRAALAHICRLADMDVGSVEYLIPKGESAACFFDINPVSTYHPKAAALLGFDPYKKLSTSH